VEKLKISAKFPPKKRENVPPKGLAGQVCVENLVKSVEKRMVFTFRQILKTNVLKTQQI